MADRELAERVKAAFARARDKLEVAQKVLDAGFPADAVSPAYYAVFHVAEAALAVEGHDPKTHSGVKNLFGLFFIKTQRLPADLGSILRERKDERENGDYSVFPAISEAEAKRGIAQAKRFVDEVESFLQGQGFATRD